MKHSGNDRPPRLALAFFRWFCHPEYREDIEGDLLERFHKRRIELGVRKAKWLFTADVLLLFRPGMIRDLNSLTHDKFFTMKRSGWIKLAAISILLIVVIISPFLPGPPNRFVLGLSVFAQSAGFLGLLLIPIGIIWAIVEIRNLKNKNNENPNWRPAYSLAIVATVIITAIYLLALLIGIFIFSEFVISSLALVLGALGLKRAIAGIKKLRDPSVRQFNPMPFYLLVIPVIAFLTRIYLMEPLSDYSRNIAIKRSEALIASIEEYKIKEGQYPESMQELEVRYIKKIPSPSIMGVLNFRYNKINDHYSLSFSQWLELGSLEVIVLYDKDNLKNNLPAELAKYDYSFDLCRVKGAFASHDTSYENWRYYLLD